MHLVINTAEAAEKLRALVPTKNNSREVLELCRLYGDRVGSNPEINPMGSVMAWILLFADLESGIDGYSGKPIHSCLSGQPAVVYILLNNYFPMLAQAAFPEDFATAAIEFAKTTGMSFPD